MAPAAETVNTERRIHEETPHCGAEEGSHAAEWTKLPPKKRSSLEVTFNSVDNVKLLPDPLTHKHSPICVRVSPYSCFSSTARILTKKMTYYDLLLSILDLNGGSNSKINSWSFGFRSTIFSRRNIISINIIYCLIHDELKILMQYISQQNRNQLDSAILKYCLLLHVNTLTNTWRSSIVTLVKYQHFYFWFYRTFFCWCLFPQYSYDCWTPLWNSSLLTKRYEHFFHHWYYASHSHDNT